MTHHVIFVPGETTAIDYAERHPDGHFIAAFSRDPLDEIRRVQPRAMVGTEDEFIEQQSRALTTAPQIVSRTHYERAATRGINWQSSSASDAQHGGVTFVVDDLLAGNVVTIYAHVGRRHWRFQGVATLPHADIIRRVQLQEIDHDNAD